MKKLNIYTFLITLILFTGCSQKEIEVISPKVKPTTPATFEKPIAPTNSESFLNNVQTIVENDVVNDTLIGSGESGHYFMINGKKVFIENIYFGFDKFTLSSDMKLVAKSNAIKLLNVQSGTVIKIEGNSDEWGTDEYNYALALKRAKVVKDTLIMDGISANSISIVSFGESNPACSEKNKTCWAKNRRSEYKLIK